MPAICLTLYLFLRSFHRGWNFVLKGFLVCFRTFYRKMKKTVAVNGIKVRVFFRKSIEKKRLCRHDKNYYYFLKSNVPVINFIADSRNMIKVSKKYVFVKNQINGESQFKKKTDNFLAFVIVFEWGRILESAMDKYEVKCNAKLRRN